MDIAPLLTAAAIGYLLGSIPSGLVLTRLFGLGDIRKIGSGNIGATNVLRTGNKPLAAATLLLDVAKGALPAALAPQILGGWEISSFTLGHVAGLAAFLGHLFPVWLCFRGGKGVATYIGVLIGLAWPAALVFCGIWLAIAFIYRYSSLSALVAAALAPLAALQFSSLATFATLAFLSLLLIFKHHANIRRLIEGREPKIGAKSETTEPTTH